MRIYPLKIIAFYFGCLGCYLIQSYLFWTPVSAAASMGLVGSFLHFPKMYEKKGLHSAIYAGAFAGMASRQILEGPLHVLIASVIGGITYVLLKPYFNGFAGKLGLIAFMSTLTLFIAKSLL